MQLRSPAFDHKSPIPEKYTGEGSNISPPLSWSGVPPRTRELALICEDPDAPRTEPWVHWILYKIPADLDSLKEGSIGGGLQGMNTWGRREYGGPMPPPGHGTHHYHFHLFALDAGLDLPAGASKQDLLDAMEGHILAEADLVGTYER